MFDGPRSGTEIEQLLGQCLEIAGVKGFFEEVSMGKELMLLLEGLAIVARHEDGGGIGEVFADLGVQFGTAHLGHGDVGDDELELRTAGAGHLEGVGGR